MKKNIGRKTPNVTRVYIWYEFMADFMIKKIYMLSKFLKKLIN